MKRFLTTSHTQPKKNMMENKSQKKIEAERKAKEEEEAKKAAAIARQNLAEALAETNGSE